MAELRQFCRKHLCAQSSGGAVHDERSLGADMGLDWRVLAIVVPVIRHFSGVFLQVFLKKQHFYGAEWFS